MVDNIINNVLLKSLTFQTGQIKWDRGSSVQRGIQQSLKDTKFSLEHNWYVTKQ